MMFRMNRAMELGPHDNFHLRAAEGWLELGNHIAANEELEEIALQWRVHPDVLEVRWQIYAKSQKWEACVDVAKAITELAPSRPNGWVHLGYSLRRSKNGGLQAAWATLLPVAEKFPNTWNIPYNLACYAAQMQQLNIAEGWLKKAFDSAKITGCFDEVRLLALSEPDLDQFWKGNSSAPES